MFPCTPQLHWWLLARFCKRHAIYDVLGDSSNEKHTHIGPEGVGAGFAMTRGGGVLRLRARRRRRAEAMSKAGSNISPPLLGRFLKLYLVNLCFQYTFSDLGRLAVLGRLKSPIQPDKHQTDTSLLVPENFAVAFWLVSSFDVQRIYFQVPVPTTFSRST